MQQVTQLIVPAAAICDIGPRGVSPMDGAPERTEVPLQTIGRYRLISEIGRGSMARVYLAADPNIDRRVALKVLEPLVGVSSATQLELETRFLMEARAAARLDHPGAVAIYDADRDSGSGLSYIAMQWVDGPSLAQRLKEGPALEHTEAAQIACQVAGALEAAHRQGLIHRDVKPGNILLDRQGRAKLSDFGIVKVDDLQLTFTGQILGTPAYMSPEQILDQGLDGRSDLFSLAVVLYLCLAGSPPFSGDNMPALTHKIVHCEPRPLRELDPKIPAELAAVVERALAKKREDRFQTAAELQAALEAAIARSAPEERTVTLSTGSGARSAAPAAGTGTAPSPRVGLLKSFAVATAAALLLVLAGLVATNQRNEVPAEPVSLTGHDEVPADSTAGKQPTRAAISPVEGRVHDQPTAQPFASDQARLELLFTNRTKKGWISIWIDGDRVSSRSLDGPKGLVQRVAGQEVRLTVPVSPGRHLVEVRVTGVAGKVDSAKQTETIFSAGETRTLRAVVLPPGILRLSWR